MAEYQIILSGSGGQGIIFAGVLLGEAASIYDGKNAAQTASYGIESRGGFSSSGVIISDKEIICPEVSDPDLILTLTQQAYDRYRNNLSSKALLIYDNSTIKGDSTENVCSYPLSEMAVNVAKKAGIKAMVNLISIGLVVAISKEVSIEAIEKAMESKYEKNIAQKNMQLVKAGLSLVDKTNFI